MMLHSPDGQVLRVESHQIFAIRGLTKDLEQHVAAGTKTVIFAGGQKFGIKETPEEIETMIANCEDNN